MFFGLHLLPSWALEEKICATAYVALNNSFAIKCLQFTALYGVFQCIKKHFHFLQMRKQVTQQIVTIRHKFSLSDIVSDYEEIISMRYV